MKRLLVFLLLLGSSPLAFSQGTLSPPLNAFKVVNGVTTPLAGATITVCAAGSAGIPCSPPLSGAIFKDAALTQSLSNPFAADASGNYQFATSAGNYTVTVSAAGYVGFSYQISIGGRLNCPNAGIAYSTGVASSCDINTSLDGNGNLVAKAITANGAGQSYTWGTDNPTFSAPSGEWALASIAGVNHLFDIGGVDYGRVLGSNACGASTTGSVVGVLCLNSSGLALTAQLGTGTQDSTTCLHGDNTWSACAAGSGATPACKPIGSSDTLTAAGTFATTCNPTLTLGVGAVIEIRAHGVYTTTATASPLLALQVNAGGTTGLCSNTSNINPGINKTAGLWELHCYIQIVTTGAPGTALVWGRESLYNPNGGAPVGPVEWLSGPFAYTTTSAQTFSIQVPGTVTMVTGQSITLQSFFVRQY